MKQLITDYIFNPAEKTIIFKFELKLEQVLLITNVTDQIIIYNFADTSLGGTVYGNTLTLEYDTLSMDSADSLQIFIDVIEEVSHDNSLTCIKGLLEQVLTELKISNLLLADGDESEDLRSHFNNLNE